MSNNVESRTSLEGRNHHLDVVKLLASMAVVVIHVTGNTTGDKYYKPVLDLAVPCFFMITGYLVGQRSQEYLINYVKSIAKLYLKAWVFYWLVDSVVLGVGLGINLKEYIRDFILTRLTLKMIVSGEIGKYHLWYLSASIIGIIIFMVLKKLNVPDWLMVVIGLIGYILILKNPTSYVSNGGFIKAFYNIALGYTLKNRVNLKYDKKRFLMLPFIVLLVYTLPIIRMRSTIPFMTEMMVSLTSVFIIYFAVTTYLPKNKLTDWGKKMTDNIYIFHPFALQVLVYMGGFEVGEGWNRTGWTGTLTLFILTYLATIGVVYVNNYLEGKVRELRT